MSSCLVCANKIPQKTQKVSEEFEFDAFQNCSGCRDGFGSAMALADLRPKSKTAAGPGKATGLCRWVDPLHMNMFMVSGRPPPSRGMVLNLSFTAFSCLALQNRAACSVFDTPDWLAWPQMLQIEVFLVYYSYLSFLSI